MEEIMDNKLKIAIQDNAMGVLHLDRGEFSLAVSLLSRALSTTNEALREGRPECNDTETTSIDNFMALHSHNVFEHELDGGVIYRKGIMIPHDITELPAHQLATSCSLSQILIAAVVFNLALAHQFIGEENLSSPLGKTMLAKAAKLYELAYKLQESKPTGSAVYYVMATLNNMGQVYRLLDRETHAKECFSHLLSIYFFVLDHTKDQRESSETTNHYKIPEDGFLQSLSFFILGGHVACAPAA